MGTSDFEQQVMQSIEASIEVKRQLLNDGALISKLAKVSEVLRDAIQQGNKLLLFGNGGSAADSQHIAAEFVGR
ncbi:MAG TPA: SIS domain-containing protein, partial [Chthoniobacterales bacterium]|nr:SIS domain-containing protein [Chthoniobacterales bacterium]